MSLTYFFIHLHFGLRELLQLCHVFGFLSGSIVCAELKNTPISLVHLANQANLQSHMADNGRGVENGWCYVKTATSPPCSFILVSPTSSARGSDLLNRIKGFSFRPCFLVGGRVSWFASSSSTEISIHVSRTDYPKSLPTCSTGVTCKGTSDEGVMRRATLHVLASCERGRVGSGQ